MAKLNASLSALQSKLADTFLTAGSYYRWPGALIELKDGNSWQAVMKQVSSEEKGKIESTCTVAASVKDVRGCLGTEMVVMMTSWSSRDGVGINLALFRLKKYRNILFVLVDHKLQPKKGFNFHCLKNRRGLKLRENVVQLGRIFLKELVCKFVEK